MQVIENCITREHEYEADNFTFKYNYEKDLIGSLKKLTTKSLANLTPDKWYVFFYYSHPTLVERIRNLKVF